LPTHKVMWSAWPNSSSAFIDDHSRLIPGHRWGFADDTVRLAAALRQAVQSWGVPRESPASHLLTTARHMLMRGCCGPAQTGVRLTHSTRPTWAKR